MTAHVEERMRRTVAIPRQEQGQPRDLAAQETAGFWQFARVGGDARGKGPPSLSAVRTLPVASAARSRAASLTSPVAQCAPAIRPRDSARFPGKGASDTAGAMDAAAVAAADERAGTLAREA